MSVRVQDVDVVGVSVLETEQDAPSGVHVDRPEVPQIALQLVQPDTVQSCQRLEVGGRVDLPKPPVRESDIHAGKPGFAMFDELPRRGALDRADHAYSFRPERCRPEVKEWFMSARKI